MDKTGGAAFPKTDVVGCGMTLRDYFAAKAMQGILANPEYDMPNESLAGEAYKIADAMIRQRDKGE